jgi:hypothetical protein
MEVYRGCEQFAFENLLPQRQQQRQCTQCRLLEEQIAAKRRAAED